MNVLPKFLTRNEARQLLAVDESSIELGDTARDTITQFTGVVVAITHCLNGCKRVTLQPRELKDGSPIDSHTFDFQQLEVVEKADHAPQKVDLKANPGGPRMEPSRRSDPR